MKIIQYQCLLLITALFFACSPSSTPKSNQNTFFSLKDYFEAASTQLGTIKEVKKIVAIDGVEESKTLNNLDINKELKIFKDCDINKTAWLEKYKVDTILKNNEYEVNYTALDDKLKTKKINIKFNKKEPTNISIHRLYQSLISESEQLLNYQVNVGYSIESKQKVVFFPEKIHTVKVTF